MKILVGLSGGVDSAVTALLLKQQGFDVIGATMTIWGNHKIKTAPLNKNACYSPDEKEDIEEAKKIADSIGIPYYVFDCHEDYEKIVLDNFKTEYLKGRTPNPCIWCNSQIKFKVLPYIAKKNGVEFDKFATGHYARVIFENGEYYLKKGIADKKDQSYFLYRLTQEQLKDIILPLGTYNKEEIREIARENNIPSAEKHDSQDFYSGDYNELLEIQDKEGNIVDTSGKILGRHKGIWNYTVGQRKGIGIAASEPLYVIKLNAETNEVIVGTLDKTFKKHLTAVNINWINKDKNLSDKKITAKIRSTQIPVPAHIELNENNIEVEFEDYQKSIAIGQSVVFYNNDTVLGGGIIDSVY